MLIDESGGAKGYGTAVDWWGLGTVLYETLSGLLPWYTRNRQEKDEHLPPLSVEETLEFAHAVCKEEVVAQRGKNILSHGTPEQNEAALRIAESLFKNFPRSSRIFQIS